MVIHSQELLEQLHQMDGVMMEELTKVLTRIVVLVEVVLLAQEVIQEHH